MLALFCAFVFIHANPIKATMQAAAIFFELNTNKVPLVVAPVARHPAEVTNVIIPVANAVALRGLVYMPTDVERPPAIVLFHGVHRLGYDEPRLVAFASALARCGYQVLTPELPELRDYRITPATVSQMRTSILYYAQRSNQKVSVLGLSFAGGLALMAVDDATVQQHVKAVLSVGGHASFTRVADYYMTGTATGADGKTFTQPPHDYGPLILAYNHMGDYVPAADVAPLTAVLKAHLYENPQGQALLESKLTPRQATEWKMLEGANRPEELALAEASAKKHSGEMDAVSPEGHVADVHVPVYLLHGAGDSVIPPTELGYLEHDLPPHTVHAALVSRLISHVSFGEQHPTPADYWHGLRFLSHFLEAASA
jgi:dienelactone hydrolase